MIETIEIETIRNIDISTFADYDVFLFDDHKIIHIATAGMNLINSLEEFNPEIDNLSKVLRYRRVFKTETNSDLFRENANDLTFYQSSFIDMTKRGFFSYDKVDIDNPNDYKFQLISKPDYENKKIIITDSRYNNFEIGDLNSNKNYKYDLVFLRAKNNFPDDFKIFDISEFI